MRKKRLKLISLIALVPPAPIPPDVTEYVLIRVPVARLGRGINPRNGFGVDLPVGIVFHVCSLMMTREKGQDKSIDTPEVTRQAYVGMLLFWESLQDTKTYFDFHYH